MEQSTPNYLSPEEHACCRSGFSSPLGTQSKERGSGKSGPKPVASDLLSASSNADTLDPAMLPKPLRQQLPPMDTFPRGSCLPLHRDVTSSERPSWPTPAGEAPGHHPPRHLGHNLHSQTLLAQLFVSSLFFVFCHRRGAAAPERALQMVWDELGPDQPVSELCPTDPEWSRPSMGFQQDSKQNTVINAYLDLWNFIKQFFHSSRSEHLTEKKKKNVLHGAHTG